jgi:signal peptidase I
MSTLTGLLYGCLIVFLGGWYVGKWSGNFSLLLLVLTMVTMAYWLVERFYFAPRRLAAANELEAQAEARRAQLAAKGIDKVDGGGDISQARQTLLAQPWWLDWTAGLFPVILVVFLLRSFLFEPFKIPSGSMIPTLLVGDLILVNKFHYGIRLPVINKKIVANHQPERGDVMVFRYPRNPSIDYIKRVVGIPGDEISYRNQLLYLNGAPVPSQPVPDFYNEGTLRYEKQYVEGSGAKSHNILVDRTQPSYARAIDDYAFRENCSYTVEGVTCKVPAGHYFMMGDNRDHSEDSRYWGFVPDENIVGRAFLVWMNFGNVSRIGFFH